VPNLPVADLRGLAGHLAHEVYGRPSQKLWTMGVTGTNGKTSCSHWLAQACSACGARTAVVGTLGTANWEPARLRSQAILARNLKRHSAALAWLHTIRPDLLASG
jgi:UDP-N-acetylmuramoyl-L-alanyl-D-glutamate--2,6-diaminopimelate ligase